LIALYLISLVYITLESFGFVFTHNPSSSLEALISLVYILFYLCSFLLFSVGFLNIVAFLAEMLEKKRKIKAENLGLNLILLLSLVIVTIAAIMLGIYFVAGFFLFNAIVGVSIIMIGIFRKERRRIKDILWRKR